MSIRVQTAVAGLFLLAYVCVVNGAVPGYFAPTTAQIVWTTGFAKSFINDGFSIYAHNFGIPGPAAMPFGLTGGLTAAGFLKLGLLPVDAYAATFALWLGVAFIGAYGMARHLGCGRLSALLMATTWLTMPVVWLTHGFGLVALGFALLPFYLLATARLVDKPLTLASVAFFVVACFIASFMDGYSYMMFVVAAGVLLADSLLKRRDLLTFTARAIVVAIGFGGSFGAYAAYQGSLGFDTSPIDFFRGWGASVEFFLVPTAGFLAIPDALGWSAGRSPDQYFGDASTFWATFCAPLMLAALLMLAAGRKDWRGWIAFAAIAAFAFYMALGPTVKFLTYRPAGVNQLMPASYGWFETGNEWISTYLPGFKNMRASYRWTAMAMAALWCVVAIGLPRIPMQWRAWLLLGLLALNVPAPAVFGAYGQYRNMLLSMDAEIEQMKPYFKPGEKVVFLPYRNDYLVNYLASDLGINVYNAGGDKNMVAAANQWPDAMQKFQRDTIDPAFNQRISDVLTTGTADVVVLPYIDLLWDAHVYPWKDRHQAELEPIARQIDALPGYDVVYAPHYAVIRKH